MKYPSYNPHPRPASHLAAIAGESVGTVALEARPALRRPVVVVVLVGTGGAIEAGGVVAGAEAALAVLPRVADVAAARVVVHAVQTLTAAQARTGERKTGHQPLRTVCLGPRFTE
jgi:hypothetical protein